MEKRSISFDLLIYDTLDELSESEKELMQIAVAVRENAYAPYSQFMVGAAVLLANEEIVIGNNQENASYPSGLCAERVALFQAGAKYPKVEIKTIAISASSKIHKVDRPAAPCGNCRQAIAEYEQKQNSPISILMMGDSGKIFKCESLEDILPLAFGSSYLK
jgi:cytidine deaminase